MTRWLKQETLHQDKEIPNLIQLKMNELCWKLFKVLETILKRGVVKYSAANDDRSLLMAA